MQCVQRSARLRVLRHVPLTTPSRALAAQPLRAVRKGASGRARKDDVAKEPTVAEEVTDEYRKSRDGMYKGLQEAICKKYGSGATFTLTGKFEKVPTISTGLPSLDIALGGGIAKGRFIEIFGPEASGKTTLAWHILSEAQKPYNAVYFFDVESAADPSYAERIGVDLDRLYHSSPSSADEAFDMMVDIVRARIIPAICIDSVAALSPLVEQLASAEDAQIAPQARLMSKGVRMVNSANKSLDSPGIPSSVIFINQLRTKVGVVYGSSETRPGGRALPYQSTQILDIRSIAKIQGETGDVIGQKIRVKVVKNKIAPPYKQVELDLIYGAGIDKMSSLVDAAVMMKVMEQAGSYFKYGGKVLGQGKAKAAQVLKDDPDLANKIRDETMEAFGETYHKQDGVAPNEGDATEPLTPLMNGDGTLEGNEPAEA